jgi:hypothetical protein
MIIFKENQLTEAIDLQKVQKDTLAVIAGSVKTGVTKGQRSYSEKMFVGAALGALRGVAEWLNPLGKYYPAGGNIPVQEEVDVIYRKILQSINNLDKIY